MTRYQRSHGEQKINRTANLVLLMADFLAFSRDAS